MKHTKGTWEIKRSGLISAPITIMSNSMTICRIFGSSEKETTEANANVIAVAPENLQCNIGSTEFLEKLISTGAIKYSAELSQAKLLIKQNKQIIKKATI